MKKIGVRSLSLLLICLLVLFGMGVFLARYVEHGRDWALYFSRANSGSSGEIFDRYGTSLASFNSEGIFYNPDALSRIANYHVTGDFWGRTGTGVLSGFFSESLDYSILTGTTKAGNSSLWLNIDSSLNATAYRELEKYGKGCMLICNYRTGELICMVSCPSVDPMESEAEPEEGAFINRCISAAFVPGSVFKLITAAAAIETVPDIDSRNFVCLGEYEIAGVPIICTGPHFDQDFTTAMANSCNCAFAQITVKVGHENMIKYVRDYGFMDGHSLDGIPTAAGSYPTEFIGDPELAWSGIGQSTVMVCPYSLLRFVCAVANGGLLIEPRLLMSDEAAEGERLIEPATAQRLKELMRNNVAEHYLAENFPGLEICAKTGTAELGDDTTHAWFAGFLEDESHPYAFVTLVERGGSGLGVAGALTNAVLQTIAG